MNSKKVVLKLDLHDDRDKQKAMKAVSKIPCIDSIAVDMKTMKLTVVGDIDPVYVVSKLRKHWSTEISSVGPAKEPEKKKEDPSKKEGGGGGGGGGKKKEPTEQIPAYIWPYYQYPHHIVNYPQQAATHHPQMASPYYVLHEENPNGCVIC